MARFYWEDEAPREKYWSELTEKEKEIQEKDNNLMDEFREKYGWECYP